MNSSVAICIVFAILAQNHFGYCNRYGGQAQRGQTTYSGYENSGSQSAEPNSDELIVSYGNKPKPGSQDKNTLGFCEVQEAEKAALNEAIKGLDAMYDITMKLLKKYASGDGRPTVEEDSPAIKASQDTNLRTFAKSGEINVNTIVKLQPKAENLIRRIENSITPIFRDATYGVYRAIRLSYKDDPREVQSQIDQIEPATLSLFANGIAGFYRAMREATPGEPVIIATNERAEEKSINNVMRSIRQVFFAIRYMLDAVVKDKPYGETRQYSSEIQKAKEKSVSAMRVHFRILYREIRKWGGVQSGDEKSCKVSRDIQ